MLRGWIAVAVEGKRVDGSRSTISRPRSKPRLGMTPRQFLSTGRRPGHLTAQRTADRRSLSASTRARPSLWKRHAAEGRNEVSLRLDTKAGKGRTYDFDLVNMTQCYRATAHDKHAYKQKPRAIATSTSSGPRVVRVRPRKPRIVSPECIRLVSIISYFCPKASIFAIYTPARRHSPTAYLLSGWSGVLQPLGLTQLILRAPAGPRWTAADVLWEFNQFRGRPQSLKYIPRANVNLGLKILTYGCAEAKQWFVPPPGIRQDA